MKRVRLDCGLITLVEWFIDVLKLAAPALANGLLHNRDAFQNLTWIGNSCMISDLYLVLLLFLGETETRTPPDIEQAVELPSGKIH